MLPAECRTICTHTHVTRGDEKALWVLCLVLLGIGALAVPDWCLRYRARCLVVEVNVPKSKLWIYYIMVYCAAHGVVSHWYGGIWLDFVTEKLYENYYIIFNFNVFYLTVSYIFQYFNLIVLLLSKQVSTHFYYDSLHFVDCPNTNRLCPSALDLNLIKVHVGRFHHSFCCISDSRTPTSR